RKKGKNRSCPRNDGQCYADAAPYAQVHKEYERNRAERKQENIEEDSGEQFHSRRYRILVCFGSALCRPRQTRKRAGRLPHMPATTWAMAVSDCRFIANPSQSHAQLASLSRYRTTRH